MEDRELLTAYVRDRSEEAFATLVSRYLDLVHSAALRQSGNSAQAQDVTQSVFLILARKAASLGPGTILSAWLYRTARFVSLEAIRAETRRKLREESMAELSANMDGSAVEENWNRVAPQLDHAMDQLSEPDRAAILLRFFQDRSLREVAAGMGVSEEAAKKRVARALDRLRQKLSARGITGSSSALGTALAAHAIHPAPAALASLIPGAVCHGTAAAASVQILTEGTLHMITWSKINGAAAYAAALILLTGTATMTVQHSQAGREHARLDEERQRLAVEAQRGEEQARAALAAAENESQQLRQQARELYQLRGAVSRLQADNRLEAANPNSLRLDSAPPELRDAAETLRELQFEKFVAAGRKQLKLSPLTEIERLEYNGEIDFVKNIGLALRIFATDHQDQFPKNLDQLIESGEVPDIWKEKLRDGSYEYNIFKDAETKPGLPAVWLRAPDERGIRVVVLNDGSAELIREPRIDSPAETPGFLRSDLQP
jgi:RNA polymerase sigma factor (sigma-70 family)